MHSQIFYGGLSPAMSMCWNYIQQIEGSLLKCLHWNSENLDGELIGAIAMNIGSPSIENIMIVAIFDSRACIPIGCSIGLWKEAPIYFPVYPAPVLYATEHAIREPSGRGDPPSTWNRFESRHQVHIVEEFAH